MLTIRKAAQAATRETFYLYQCLDQSGYHTLRLSPQTSSSDCRDNPQTSAVSKPQTVLPSFLCLPNAGTKGI